MNTKMMFLIFFFTGLFSQAGERYEFYNGVRALGMGGAGIAVVNDETALLVNPAALGKLRNSFGTLIDPEFEQGEQNALIYKAKSYSQFFDIASLKDSLDLAREKHYHMRGQVFPSFVLKNFGIGILEKYSLDAEMNADGTVLRADYFHDTALVFGFNFRFWDGRIKLGFNAKAINRVQVASDLDSTTSLALKDIATEGSGLGSDVGLILTAPWAWLPTLSVVVRDVSSTRFINQGYLLKIANRPDAIPQDADAAIAFFPIHANRTRSTFTFEQKGILTQSTVTDKTRLYHLGYELNLADIFFFRAGMNQRYYTVGLEMASEHFQFQTAYYGEDIGVDGTPEEDRRVVFKFAYRY